MPPSQVRVLTLNAGENRESKLFRLEKSWHLRFTIGPSLLGKSVRLFCNHPVGEDSNYDRDTYYELQWRSPSGAKSDHTDFFADVKLFRAGSFSYFFTIDKSEEIKNANGSGFFLVDPTIFLSETEELTLDCLQVQSVLTKLLGPFDEWEGRLKVAAETAYNMVHFTPIQELGASNSAYSIRDQNTFSPVYSPGDTIYNFDDVSRLVEHMKKDWKVLSMTDLVYNHTSYDSPWLQKHPECSFNLQNSPHLKPAYVVDRIFYHFNREVATGRWACRGVPIKLNSEEHLKALGEVLREEIFPKYKLHQYFTVDVEATLRKFRDGIENKKVITGHKEAVTIIQDPNFKRLGCYIDIDAALKIYNLDRPGATSRQERIRMCCGELERRLEELNAVKEKEMHDHLNAAVDHYVANARWRFVNPSGDLLGEVTKKEPLMHEYFICPESHEGSVEKEENMMNGDGGKYIMASNGWVMGDDPLKNFAEPGRNVYLRRELVVWGDSVKLNYGQKPEDCPYLWFHMLEYTKTTARIFHGVRLDNCHSTPLHVAEYMLDQARVINPDLYVIAELFTGSENIDNIFMNRLGINSLIREALSAWDAHEEGRLVHRYGGLPVGAFVQPRVQPLIPTCAHALFYDQTHDNESPLQKRSAYDLFPSAALVSMACCASGSNRGYDQLVPHHIHVVNEKRLYTSWADWDFPEKNFIGPKFGITAGKKALNKLHFEMGCNGFNQVYVDQIDGEVVSVTRHNPQTHESVLLVAHTAFSNPGKKVSHRYIRPITVQGMVVQIALEGKLCHADSYEYTKDPNFVNGLPEYYLELQEAISPDASNMVKVEYSADSGTTQLHFVNFPPGSVVAIRSNLPPSAKHAILEIRRKLGQFGYLMRSYSGHTMFDETCDESNFMNIVENLDLTDMNYVLYRSDAEEKSDGNGFGTYNIPGSGPLVYCGLRGLMAVLAEVRPKNDLGHPICNNLREGDWMPSYIANRLKVHKGTRILANWFEETFTHLSKAPRYLIPSYFDAIISGAYVVFRDRIVKQMSHFIQDGSTFVQALCLGSVQFCGFVKTSKLPPLSPNLVPPSPPTDEETQEQACLSLAAGLPHFCVEYLRNWGRDTFISLRGLLLLSGRFQEARYIILAYAGCLRHGLIPNLLSEGVKARYNCRDAVWFWLQAIQEYSRLAPDGISILQDKVLRLFPTDDYEGSEYKEQPLFEVMQEALQRHADGVEYRERNAGETIDNTMSEKGFDNAIGVDWETGFIFGGTEHNCGTWMDKMGSSAEAEIRGKPATPRDGSAVELIGLCKSAIRWLADLSSKGVYPYDAVKATVKGSQVEISFKTWCERIDSNFEKKFWVHSAPLADEETPELIARRGIYKDCHNATQFWTNHQLRPNYPIAMVMAPEMFTPKNAWNALTVMEEVLLGPLGMKTLDPKDWAYCGDYFSGNPSVDPKVAGGFNYHQGPEWVWPIGYFLRAKLHFARILEADQPGILKETKVFVEATLTKHYEEVISSPWQSLPELTNKNGSFCSSSCRAQAWSVGSVLEVLYDLEKIHQ